jgi:Transglycosylase SLT domain
MVAYPGVQTLPKPGARGALRAAAAILLLAPPLHAAEHITLRNGFDLICDRREAAGDRVRLYMSATGNDFLEVRPEEIASSESIVLPETKSALQSSLPASEPTRAEIREMTAAAGRAHDLDVELLDSVIRAESGGNVHAVSRTGAQGLMQLMPGTASELGVTDSFRADQNINGGTAYLNALLLQYHDNLALALAAYNAGPAAVAKYHGIPPYRETRLYVARIIRDFNRRKLAAAQTAHATATHAGSTGMMTSLIASATTAAAGSTGK